MAAPRFLHVRAKVRRVRVCAVALSALILSLFLTFFRVREREEEKIERIGFRRPLSIEVGEGSGGVDVRENDTSTLTPEEPVTWRELEGNASKCLPSALEEFPDDLFTDEQRENGAITLHILGVGYLFVAVAIVCDDYFVTSLEELSEALHLSSDVAGATFMAAGSSAPELFTALIAAFIAENDIGLGTIMGSAVYNILFITFLCCFFSGSVIFLTPWPFIRDSFCYFLAVLSMVVIIYDGTVYWYEGLIFCVLYGFYVFLMKFNARIQTRLLERWSFFRTNVPPEAVGGREEVRKLLGDAEEDLNPGGRSRSNTAHSQFHRSRASSYVEHQHRHSQKVGYLSDTEQIFQQTREKGGGTVFASPPIHDSCITLTDNSVKQMDGEEHNLDRQVSEFISPLSFPGAGCLHRLYWLLVLPINLLFVLTVPDCRRPSCKKYWALSFTMSVVWIAVLSYLLVWFITVVGHTFGIPDTVMGLTFLAAGTSVPDAIASVIVCRDGYGDMAMSNILGSNVFDVCCLGLPWLLKTLIFHPEEPVYINSAGLSFSSLTLLGTVFLVSILVWLTEWRLTRRLGLACLILYLIFLTFSILYEMNVFGYLNPPTCGWN